MGMMDMVRRSVLLSALHKATEGPAASLSFSTDTVVSLPSVAADIAPAQSGSGTPSPDNVRPITGRTGLTLTHTDGDDSSTIAVDWTDDAGTIYGGTLDLVTGKLTVTHEKITFDGTESWSQNSSTYCRITYGNNTENIKGSASCICNMFPNFGSSYYPENGKFSYRNANGYLYLVFRMNGVTDTGNTTAWKTQLATWSTNGTPLEVVVAYIDPVEVTLTPNQIKPFLGQNSMSTSAGDNLTVSYWKHN